MSREYPGSAGGHDTYTGHTNALNDALTLLCVLRIVTTSDLTWLSFLEFEVGGAVRCAIGRRSNGEIYFANSAGLVSAVTIDDADGWMIVAVTRTAAAATTMHKIPIGGSRTSTAAGALADGLTAASATVKVAGDDDPAAIRMAAWAYWASELSTANLDSIASAKSTQSILDLSPLACYDDSDGFAADLVAALDRTAAGSGITDSGDDPTGWTYYGAGAATSLVVSRRAHAGLKMRGRR